MMFCEEGGELEVWGFGFWGHSSGCYYGTWMEVWIFRRIEPRNCV